MKLYTQARKYGAKVVTGVALTAGAVAAHADPIEDIFAAANLSTVSASVVLLGVAVIGISLAYKGIDLVKRAVRKA